MSKSYFQRLFDIQQQINKLDRPLNVEEKLSILMQLKGTLGKVEEIERFIECEKLQKEMGNG